MQCKITVEIDFVIKDSLHLVYSADLPRNWLRIVTICPREEISSSFT